MAVMDTEIKVDLRQSPVNTNVVQNIEEGEEPGASTNHYLVTTDSYEELEEYTPDQNGFANQTRKKSGTISEIKREYKHRGSSNSLIHEGASSNTTSDLETDSDRGFSSSQEFDKPELAGEAACTVTIQKLRKVSASSEPDPDREYVQSKEWKDKKKHVFILSQSGKPVYSRHGNEDKIVTIFGVMQALVSFLKHSDEKDTLRCIVAGQRKFIFLIREHLILVAVTRMDECVRHIQLQLSYVYNQVLSILTLAQLNKIFQQRVNYDLRRMLTGTEKFIDNLLSTMDVDSSYLLGSVKCLSLNVNVRETITQTLVQHCKVKDLVFAIMISNNQLVTLVRLKKFALHPQDLHLVLNLVHSSDAFKASESWLPICLPKFDSNGFLHAYVSYLDEPCNACLLLLTVDNNQFAILSECKKKVVERLNRHSCLQAIAESVAAGGYTIEHVEIPELRHFIYKSKSTAQFTCPELGPPYVTDAQKERLHSLYLNVHGRMHGSTRPLRIMYKVTEYESILGWVTDGFELYAVYSPLVTKGSAISCVNRLLKWMKKEESRLFILNPTTF